MKIRVGLFFGGNSVEHEISVITGLQAAEYIDKEKYEVVPVYITKDNRFYTGEETGKIENYKDIPALLKSAGRAGSGESDPLSGQKVRQQCGSLF